jgi:hypothetical protein
MSTNARSWFFNAPEPNAFAIVERLNGTFWQARLTQLIFTRCTSATAPIRCEGYFRDTPLEVEWEPGKWLAVRCTRALDALAPQIARIIGAPATFGYQDETNRNVIEFHRDAAGSQARWLDIQGKPAFHNPQRLTAP